MIPSTAQEIGLGQDSSFGRLLVQSEVWYQIVLQGDPGPIEGRLILPQGRGLVVQWWCPRSLAVWFDGLLVVNRELSWRSFQRSVEAVTAYPLTTASVHLRMMVGERPKYPEHLDRESPSPNRQLVLQALSEQIPDALCFSIQVTSAEVPSATLGYSPSQFSADHWRWQWLDLHQNLATSDLPSYSDALMVGGDAVMVTRDGAPPARILAAAGPSFQRVALPLWRLSEWPQSLRSTDSDHRTEPVVEVVKHLPIRITQGARTISLNMPMYESLGRNLEKHTSLSQTSALGLVQEWEDQVPKISLEGPDENLVASYREAWQMIRRLIRIPDPHSGLPGPYVSTGSNFPDHQFVWDTAFTAMAIRFGWKAFPIQSSLDLIYSRQFDGGYIHREIDVHTGLPALYEPDFSPNPPLLAEAEWRLAQVTGDRDRIFTVYPILAEYHQWLWGRRRLVDGTYWTTGLANGLDNSPALGEGYVCLTAQMIQDADVLARMAKLLGDGDAEHRWHEEAEGTRTALNSLLWNEQDGIYSSRLKDGGHNANQVVTAFWPLWAGAVPAHRIDALVAHLDRPSFNRYHPVPSLAFASPDFVAEGGYWRGAVWPPTNFAVIQGLLRVGRQDVAVRLGLQHLRRVTRVLQRTGRLWENYSSESDEPGMPAAPDYAWAALGPIAVLIEVILGVRPDALHQTVWWNPGVSTQMSIENLAVGSAKLSLRQWPVNDQWMLLVETDQPVTLKRKVGSQWVTFALQPGIRRMAVDRSQ